MSIKRIRAYNRLVFAATATLILAFSTPLKAQDAPKDLTEFKEVISSKSFSDKSMRAPLQAPWQDIDSLKKEAHSNLTPMIQNLINMRKSIEDFTSRILNVFSSLKGFFFFNNKEDFSRNNLLESLKATNIKEKPSNFQMLNKEEEEWPSYCAADFESDKAQPSINEIVAFSLEDFKEIKVSGSGNNCLLRATLEGAELKGLSSQYIDTDGTVTTPNKVLLNVIQDQLDHFLHQDSRNAQEEFRKKEILESMAQHLQERLLSEDTAEREKANLVVENMAQILDDITSDDIKSDSTILLNRPLGILLLENYMDDHLTSRGQGMGDLETAETMGRLLANLLDVRLIIHRADDKEAFTRAYNQFGPSSAQKEVHLLYTSVSGLKGSLNHYNLLGLNHKI